MSKVWKITTNLTEQENTQLLSNMTEQEHEMVAVL